MDLISVIITTYNRSTYIEETLLSIQNQTYQNIEILVVDDGSNVNIAQEVKTICLKFSKCQYFWKPNSGQPDSRNFGIKLAKGDFFAFCDDDDYWVLNKLEKQLKILKNNQDFDIVTGSIGFIDKNSNVLNKIKSHKGNNHGYIFEDLLKKNRMSSVDPLLRKSVFDKTGYFNPKFTFAEDWDFWRKAAYSHKFYNQDEIMAYVRIHDNNMSYKETSLADRILLYIKLTKSLLEWGRNIFNENEFLKIKKTERNLYYKWISNNKNNKFQQIYFLLHFVINNPKKGFYLLKSVL